MVEQSDDDDYDQYRSRPRGVGSARRSSYTSPTRYHKSESERSETQSSDEEHSDEESDVQSDDEGIGESDHYNDDDSDGQDEENDDNDGEGYSEATVDEYSDEQSEDEENFRKRSWQQDQKKSFERWRVRADPTVPEESEDTTQHEEDEQVAVREIVPRKTARRELERSRSFSFGESRQSSSAKQDVTLERREPNVGLVVSSSDRKRKQQSPSSSSSSIATAKPIIGAVVKAVLKPYQRRVVETMKRDDVHGLIVAHSLGHGKTLTAIAVADWFLKSKGQEGKVIVISPKSVLKNFREEKILKFDGVPPDTSRYIFVTKQTFSRGLLNRVANDKTLLIIDEAHNYRTSFVGSSGKEVSAALDCASRAGKVLLLTGTPVYNRPSDICNLVAMAKGEVKPLSPQQFDLVCSSDESLRMYLTLPSTNPPVSVFDLHLPAASTSDYPAEHNRIIRVPMPASLYRTYRMIEQQNHPLYNQDSPWIFLNGVRQAMNQIEGYAWSPKIETAFRLTKEAYDRKQRVLLYSAFLDKGVFLLQQKLAENNMLFSRITGEETVEDRRRAVHTYNEREGSILIVSKAGGEGLNLMATRVVILLESGWNEPGERQVIGRAIRYRSHSHLPQSERFVTVYRLLLVKPDIHQRDPEDNPETSKTAKESADEIVHKHNQIKSVVCNDFMERVQTLVSDLIERNIDQVPSEQLLQQQLPQRLLSTRRTTSSSSPSKVQISIEDDD